MYCCVNWLILTFKEDIGICQKRQTEIPLTLGFKNTLTYSLEMDVNVLEGTHWQYDSGNLKVFVPFG